MAFVERTLRAGRNALAYIQTPGALRARLTWPHFSWSIFRTLDRLRRGGASYQTILDVGANIGVFSVAASEFFPGARIEAFEPIPDCREKFLRNVARTSGTQPRLWSVALGRNRSRATFHVNEHTPSSSILRMLPEHEVEFPDARRTRPIDVEIETLDDLMSAIGPSRPCLLKIDVQGYELEVLSGGPRFLAFVDDVIVECSVRPLYDGAPSAEEVISILSKHGFCLSDVAGELREGTSRRAMQFDLQFSRPKNPLQP